MWRLINKWFGTRFVEVTVGNVHEIKATCRIRTDNNGREYFIDPVWQEREWMDELSDNVLCVYELTECEEPHILRRRKLERLSL